MAKKDTSGIEIIESAEALQKEIGKAEGFLKKNQSLLAIAGGAIVAIALGIFGYNYWTNTQNEEAQAAMMEATFAFEADSLSQALNGVGGSDGMLAIAEDYSSTKAGNLANMYAGIALLKQGKFDDAISHLEKFSSDDLVLQGRAYALIGDAYMEKKNAAEAISFYEKAANFKPNKYMTPGYLMKLALAQEVAGKKAEAIETYNSVINEYPTSMDVVNAKKYKAKLEASK